MAFRRNLGWYSFTVTGEELDVISERLKAIGDERIPLSLLVESVKGYRRRNRMLNRNVRDVPIGELGLSLRSLRSIRRAGATTLGGLIQ